MENNKPIRNISKDTNVNELPNNPNIFIIKMIGMIVIIKPIKTLAILNFLLNCFNSNSNVSCISISSFFI